MQCRKGYDVKTLRSDEGWYMGVNDRDGGEPNCRLTEYAETRKRANQLPLYRQFYCADNEYCNKGYGCFK